jgi:ADP-heptose:LPS heptosyltransferase
MMPAAPTDSWLKRVELAVRRAFVRGVRAGNIPRMITRPMDAFKLNAPRILILRQDRIGDVLVSEPIVRAIRAALPAATIELLLSPNNLAALPAMAPHINGHLVYEKGLAGLIRTIRTIRAQRYDIVIDLMDNASSTSSMIVSYARSRYALGIHKENAAVYSHVVPLRDKATVHIVDRLGQLLLAFDRDPATLDLRLHYPVSEADRAAAITRLGGPLRGTARRFGVNISGSGEHRMYPAEGIIDVVRATRREHPEWDVVLLAAPQERERQLAIAQASGARAIEPSSSFHEFACTLSVLDAVMTVDTSAVHVIAAAQVPSVVLFVHNDPGLLPWYPYRSLCEPLETIGAQVAEIPVADVIAAVHRTLSGVEEQAHHDT